MCTIPPDPDVSGIGVRAAVYIQAVVSAFQFAFIPLLLHAFRKGRHLQQAKHFYHRGRASMSALLITSMGLLISTCIKLGSEEFSRYHVIISLNLVWTLCLSAISNTLVLLGMERAAPILELEATDYRHVARRRPSSRHHVLHNHAHMMPFRATLDRIAMVLCLLALGYMEALTRSRSNPLVCDNLTVVWMYGRVLPVTSDAVEFHRFVWSYFAFWPAVLYEAALMVPLFWRIHRTLEGNPFYVRLLQAGPFPSQRIREVEQRPVNQPSIFLGQFAESLFLGLASICAGLSLSIIIATEKTIAANNVAEGETVWGFGQIMAMLLVVTPVWDALRTAWGVLSLWRHPKAEQEFDLRLLPTANV